MRTVRILALIAVMSGALQACALLSAEPVRDGAVPMSPSQAGFSSALQRAFPSVVGVYVRPPEARVSAPSSAPSSTPGRGESAPEFDDDEDASGLWRSAQAPSNIGAGFFVDGKGHVVTAAHVVAGANTVRVLLSDQRVLSAQIVGSDAALDLAVLRIEAAPALQPPLGQASSLRTGDWVLAVGDPYGLHRSVVLGIVGGRPRHFAEDLEGLFIQSDVALNPGNSGGPLLNAQGEIVGMNLRTVVGPYGTGGLSLSVPIEVVLQLVQELTGSGVRPRLQLGARYQDVSVWAAAEAGRPYASGALVTEVQPGGAGHRLGLRAGDIVVGMNGHAVGDGADLAKMLLSWTDWAATRLVVHRAGRYMTLRPAISPAY